MAGGTWTAQNKVRPGVYINFNSEPRALGTLGDRGVVAIPAPLPWGEPNSVIVLEASEYLNRSLELLGFNATDARIRHITAAVSHAQTVLLYRLGGTGATQATATVGNLTATAKYGGTRGNDLQFVVQADIDNATAYDVMTLLDGGEVDRQKVATVADLQPNAFITWSGTGELTETAGIPLTGGSDGSASGADLTDALGAFEAYQFNVLGVPLTDEASKQLAVAYIKRQREDEGKKVQAVLLQHPQADYEGIISLRNGVITSDGLQVSPEMMLWEIAAMQAAANVNESLTYTAIPNAVDAYPRLTNSETIQALQNGELVITATDGRALIEQDINTLTTFMPDKGKHFSKNRVLRVLDGLANDYMRVFSQSYIGKVPNNDDGRNLFKSEIISITNQYQIISAIQNFDSQTDLEVLPGADVDAVVVNQWVQPVDAIEKIYMTVTVR